MQLHKVSLSREQLDRIPSVERRLLVLIARRESESGVKSESGVRSNISTNDRRAG